MNPTPLETAGSPPFSPPDSSPQIPTTPESAPLDVPVDPDELQKNIVAILKTCFDPEIPVNIYELGLIYGIDVAPTGAVNIRMTLTSPACPAAGSLPPEVQSKAREVAGVTSCRVDVVWDPPWDKDKMSEEAKLQL